MKRWLTATTLSLCLSLVAVTGYLLLFPVSAFAAGGTADCGYGVQTPHAHIARRGRGLKTG